MLKGKKFDAFTLLGIGGFIMFSIFFEKYAKICRIALSFNHDSAADWIYSLFLHVIIL